MRRKKSRRKFSSVEPVRKTKEATLVIGAALGHRRADKWPFANQTSYPGTSLRTEREKLGRPLTFEVWCRQEGHIG